MGRSEVTDPENRAVGFQAEEPETPSHSLSCWTLDIAANRLGTFQPNQRSDHELQRLHTQGWSPWELTCPLRPVPRGADRSSEIQTLSRQEAQSFSLSPDSGGSG